MSTTCPRVLRWLPFFSVLLLAFICIAERVDSVPVWFLYGYL
jgi:hypothetical protein